MICAETERLILRSWKPEDLSAFFDMNRDKVVMRYFPMLLNYSQTDAFYNRIQSEFDRKGWGLYAVELKSTGAFIGYVGLHEIGFDEDFALGSVEIGWRLAADYHNQGYATEAALKVLELAREHGLTTIYSFTAVVNKPSERVMQKIGMSKTGEFDHPNLAEGSPLRRHVLYRMEFRPEKV